MKYILNKDLSQDMAEQLTRDLIHLDCDAYLINGEVTIFDPTIGCLEQAQMLVSQLELGNFVLEEVLDG